MNEFGNIDVVAPKSVILTNELKFAEGGNRLCFRHPEKPDLCIKITRPGIAKTIRNRKSGLKSLRPLSDFDDNAVEYKAYQQSAILNPRVAHERLWQHLPRCYGWQETNLGRGLVSDYYSVRDRLPAETLENYLKNNGLDKFSKGALTDFEDYLLDVQILTKNILPHNLVIAKDGRLKLIDGLGRLGYLPIVEHVGFARQRYVKRRIEKMWLRAKWEASSKRSTWTEVEKRGKMEV